MCIRVGSTQRDFITHLLHEVANLRPSSVHDYRPHPDASHQHNVVHHVLLQARALHRGAAVLDHDRLALELLQVRQSLRLTETRDKRQDNGMEWNGIREWMRWERMKERNALSRKRSIIIIIIIIIIYYYYYLLIILIIII